MICPYCSENHDTWTECVKSEYEGEELEYEAVFSVCLKNGKRFADTAANDIALKDAYRIKHNLLTHKMIAEIRGRYKENELRAILGKEDQKVLELGGHHVQSKEYDTALKTMDYVIQMYMHQ